MTGKIKVFRSGKSSGFIKAGNGANIYFDESAFASDVLPPLVVGQSVTFDITSGHPPRAINLSVSEHVEQEKKRPDHLSLRYVGFDQRGSVRAYKFEGICFGEETQTFVVSTELSLFEKHRVGIQDGPVMCLHILASEQQAAGENWVPSRSRLLTDQDMLTHLASKPTPGARLRASRIVRESTAARTD